MAKTDLDQAGYRANPGLSQSELKLAVNNWPLYYERKIAKTEADPEPTASMLWGTGLENYVQHGADQVVIIPDDVLAADGSRKGNRFKEWLEAQPPGAVTVTPKQHASQYRQYERAKAMLDADPIASKCLADRVWHERFVWKCPVTALDRKAETDVIDWDGRNVIDLKSAQEIKPLRFAQQAFNLHYDLQAATYLEAVQMESGTSDWGFIFVVVRNSPPFDCAVFQMSDDFLAIGREKNRRWCQEFKWRLEEGIWHNPWHGAAIMLEPPSWADKNLEREFYDTTSCD